jgi:glycosyltransferase involved in cell wall biosynthesis
VDRVGTALFRAGFVDPRFISDPNGTLIVLARRGLDKPPTDRPQVLSVVLPVYNERTTFESVMDGLLAKSIPDMAIEVILVESNSTDGTREMAVAYSTHPRVDLVLEDRPQGKGHAVRSGLARARGDIVIIQDADLEYDLDDYEKLLDPIRRFEASFVLGRRGSCGGSWGMRHFETQQLVSRIMNVGHVAFAALFNAVYRQHLKDPFTMYKVFRRDCISGMVLECNRFDFDWELTAKLVRAGYIPMEIPVSYHSRSFSEGKKVRLFGDPLSWFVACARYRFAPVFEAPSVPYGTDDLRPPFTSGQGAVVGSTTEPRSAGHVHESLAPLGDG